MLASNIEPYKLYTIDDLASILGRHTQSIYQERVELPPAHDAANPARKSRRWLGLVIINWLRVKSGLQPIEPIFGAVPQAHIAPAQQRESTSANKRQIKLPKRKPKAKADAKPVAQAA